MTGSERLTTRLNSRWTLKMFVFLLLLLGLAGWASADAFWIYPKRGRNHVQFMLKAYLECLEKNGRLLADASVEDPAAEFKRLESLSGIDPSSCDAARAQWLMSLSRLAPLSSLTVQNKKMMERAAGAPIETETVFSRPDSTLSDLQQRLGTRNAPKPLAGYDIPLQYLFLVIGAGGAVWMMLFLVRCGKVKYQYEPVEKRLFLPDGVSFVPADVAEMDKRDWHKYFIYVKLKDGSREMKFDLLRYAPLEDWILEMEKETPGYVPPEADAAEASPTAEAGTKEA